MDDVPRKVSIGWFFCWGTTLGSHISMGVTKASIFLTPTLLNGWAYQNQAFFALHSVGLALRQNVPIISFRGRIVVEP